MKMRLIISLLVFTFVFSTNTFALVHQGGTIKVTSIRISKSAVYVQFNPALRACEGGDQYRMHAKYPITQSNSKELTSALLTAYTSGQTFQYVWVSNEGTRCSHEEGATHILNLDMVEFSQK